MDKQTIAAIQREAHIIGAHAKAIDAYCEILRSDASDSSAERAIMNSLRMIRNDADEAIRALEGATSG